MHIEAVVTIQATLLPQNMGEASECQQQNWTCITVGEHLNNFCRLSIVTNVSTKHAQYIGFHDCIRLSEEFLKLVQLLDLSSLHLERIKYCFIFEIFDQNLMHWTDTLAPLV